MDSDNDNEGFELNKETFQIIQYPPLHLEHSCSEIKTKESSLTPPVSTYTIIDNYPTPTFLNNVYSPPLCAEPPSYCNKAWEACTDMSLQKQFNCEKYAEVYRKFPEERTNYKFYREYGLDEYKTFTDPEPPRKQSKMNTIQIWEKGFLDHSPDLDLVFTSNFECGNLERVYKKIDKPNQYYLVLSNDTNTVGFNQWFYFRVFNPNFQEIKARFIIVNNNKRTIPCISQIGISYFSLDEFRFRQLGWQRCHGSVCCNSNNHLRRENMTFSHTLQFQYTVRSHQTIYFALTPPYSFTKLKNLVAKKPNFRSIGTSFSGNPIYAFETGNPESDKSIVVIARQHPSETSSSFVAEGVIDKLMKQSPLISFLKKKFVIVVIPMANPDGVIHGNSRTNLLGFDINRQWEQVPVKIHSNQVFLIYHQLLKKLPNIEYLIDLHGHSKKLNSFGYFTTKKTLATLIAMEMAQKLPWFKIADCQMAQTVVPSTLRYLASQHLNIEKSITIETSIHGWSDEEKNVYPFTPEKLEMIGSTLIEVLARLEIQKKSNRKHIKIIDFGQNHQSSDSDPEGDYMKLSSENNKKERQSEQLSQAGSRKKMGKSPRKIRIKTVGSSFYKPTLSSTIRERLKTEFAMQKIEVELPSPSPLKIRMRKRTQTMKNSELKESQKMNKRKLTSMFNQFNSSLTLKPLHVSECRAARK